MERVLDDSGVADEIEALLPVGVRPRQLKVRSLLLGMLLCLRQGRPAHLTRVRDALVSLPEHERSRLGIVADWKHGPHLLTYRQTERTYSLARIHQSAPRIDPVMAREEA